MAADVVKQEYYRRKQSIQAFDNTNLSDKSAICPHLLCVSSKIKEQSILTFTPAPTLGYPSYLESSSQNWVKLKQISQVVSAKLTSL